jgi:parallel beta-helix repeat protein
MRNLRDYLSASTDARSTQEARTIARNRLPLSTSLGALEDRKMLAALTFTPSNFNNGASIGNGDTVTFGSGSYSISSTAKNNLQKAKSLTGRSGATLNFSGNAVQVLKISGQANGSISGLTFRNARVAVENSSGFKVQNNNFGGYAGKTDGFGANDNIVSINRSNGSSISNNTVRADNTSVNMRGLAIKRSNNVSISGNKVSGRLKQGIVINETKGSTISGNTLTRDAGTPRAAGSGAGKKALGEDHGIYLLNGENTNVTNNTTQGWSTLASGHGLKLKDVRGVDVIGNTFNSGIIGRVNAKNNAKASTRLGFSNVLIHNNRGNGGVNIFTQGKGATNVRITGTKISGGESIS